MNLMTQKLDEPTEQAAYLSIEAAIRRYFGVRDCIVDLDTNRASILFDPYRHRWWIESLGAGDRLNTGLDVAVSVSLPDLPKEVIAVAQPILNRLLDQNLAYRSFCKWKKNERQVVEGSILEKNDAGMLVSLRGAVGICGERDLIESEAYRTGEWHLFKVKQVRFSRNRTLITLSRRAREIPEFVLEAHFPQYAFTCYRRIPGVKSWIRTTAARSKWGRFFSRDIWRHLAFEHIEFKK